MSRVPSDIDIPFPTFADAKRALFLCTLEGEDRVFRIALACANTEEHLRELFDYLEQGDVFAKYHLAIQLFSKLEKLKLESKPMGIAA